MSNTSGKYGYLTLDLSALLEPPAPLAEMTVTELEQRLTELRRVFASEYRRIVGHVAVTNLADHEDRVSTAQHHLRRLAHHVDEIMGHLAARRGTTGA